MLGPLLQPPCADRVPEPTEEMGLGFGVLRAVGGFPNMRGLGVWALEAFRLYAGCLFRYFVELWSLGGLSFKLRDLSRNKFYRQYARLVLIV